jgi:hypothetical protein
MTRVAFPTGSAGFSGGSTCPPPVTAPRVVHEVEIDLGELHDEMLKGLQDNFEQVRASVVRAGMEKTLENLRKTADR